MKGILDRATGAFGVAAAANITLCLAIGGLADGTRGLKIGVLVGVILAVLPVFIRAFLGWWARPGGVIRFVGSQIAASVLVVARRFFDALGAVLGPVAWALQMPVLLFRMVGTIVAGGFAAAASAIFTRLFTPLGLANLAALGVIAINTAGVEFATPITILGFGLMLLVLMVDLSETLTAETAEKAGDT